MKIGYNARFLSLPYTGIGQYTRNLIRAMAKAEPEHEYILFTPELVDVLLPSNCKQIRVAEKPYRSASLRKAHWEQILLPAEMERNQIEIAHFLYPGNPRRRLPIPTIVTVHDAIPWRLPAYRRLLRSKLYHLNARLALKKADQVITVSRFSKDEIIRCLKIPEKNIHVIYSAAPLPEENPECPAAGLRRRYFLYVGGYDERKNVPLLLLAYQKHIAPFYDVDLILAGGKNKGLERYLTREFRQKVDGTFFVKEKGRVVFTDPLSQSELFCLYRHALALTHVSLYEGFNLALAEAMQAGIPIVASDIPVHHEITREAALFVNPRSPDSVGLGMHQLIHDSALCRRLAKKGSERGKGLDWKKAAEETLYVYHLYK